MTVQWKSSLLQSLEKNSKLPYSKVGPYCHLRCCSFYKYFEGGVGCQIACAKQFFQLATVKPDGKPANRTVVYRGFDSESERMLFTTDTRSVQSSSTGFPGPGSCSIIVTRLPTTG
jgi:hypothetical protein